MVQSQQPLDQAFITGLVAGIAARLERPTHVLQSVRCLARPALVDLVLSVRDAMAMPGYKRVTATALLKVLRDAGIAHVVPLEDRGKDVREDRLYAIGFGGAVTDLDPVELLQAHEPDGVVCYFTALAILGLTTQLPAHHHIARRVNAVDIPEVEAASAPHVRAVEDGHTRGTASTQYALGSRAFSYQGIAYYTTRREAHRVIGVQTRYVNEKSRYRVTTLEQTLVDTLHRPHSCGGPAVVFEAWETAAERLDGARLADLLQAIGDSRLVRRVGYMVSQVAPALVEALRNTVAHAPTATGHDVIPLLTGIPHTTVDVTWGVGVP
jgi:predicted transcriptional regulator of viral defense system